MQELQQVGAHVEPACPPDISLPDRLNLLLQSQINLQQQFVTAIASDDGDAMRAMREHVRLLEENVKSLKIKLNTAMLDHDIVTVNAMLSVMSDPDDPDIGRKYVERFSQSNCKISVDHKLENGSGAPLAIYSSYSNGETVKGFLNEIAVNENRLGNLFSLANGIAHETFHSLQVMSAFALHLTPFNPDTLILVHPEDWIHLDNLCERDAYAKQAMSNYFLSQSYDEARERSSLDLVSVKEFEDYRGRFATLQETVVHASLNALYKTKLKGDLTSPAFWRHYQEQALQNYSAGMGQRKEDGNRTFVRLEPHDFHAVGAYDVGPNSLGKDHIDPGFLIRMPLSETQQTKIRELCQTYNIPALGDCPTLRESMQGAPRFGALPSQGGGSFSSPALHAPA